MSIYVSKDDDKNDVDCKITIAKIQNDIKKQSKKKQPKKEKAQNPIGSEDASFSNLFCKLSEVSKSTTIQDYNLISRNLIELLCNADVNPAWKCPLHTGKILGNVFRLKCDNCVNTKLFWCIHNIWTKVKKSFTMNNRIIDFDSYGDYNIPNAILNILFYNKDDIALDVSVNKHYGKKTLKYAIKEQLKNTEFYKIEIDRCTDVVEPTYYLITLFTKEPLIV